MKKSTLLALVLAFCSFISGCNYSDMHTELANRIDFKNISPYFESNINIWGEHTGLYFKHGDLTFYSQFTYEHQAYSLSKEDGLYVKNTEDTFNHKLADGVVCSIVLRDDGLYYLKLRQLGEIWLFNWDLWKYNFQSGKNELIIENCTYAQFSDDAVYYCQHYRGDKSFFIEEDLPLDLKYEGKVVKYDLATGIETIVAETDGGIFDLFVGNDTLVFSGGGGTVYGGGHDLYVSNLNENELCCIVKNESAEIDILYCDNQSNEILYFLNDLENSGFYSINYNTGEISWSYLLNNLPIVGPFDICVCDGKIYVSKLGTDEIKKNRIICLDPEIRPSNFSYIETPDTCRELYVFNNELHCVGNDHSLSMVTSGSVIGVDGSISYGSPLILDEPWFPRLSHNQDYFKEKSGNSAVPAGFVEYRNGEVYKVLGGMPSHGEAITEWVKIHWAQ